MEAAKDALPVRDREAGDQKDLTVDELLDRAERSSATGRQNLSAPGADE